jgi:hypothetical protein
VPTPDPDAVIGFGFYPGKWTPLRPQVESNKIRGFSIYCTRIAPRNRQQKNPNIKSHSNLRKIVENPL